MAEAQWMERQRTCSLRRLSKCASLRAAHSAQMMMMTMMMEADDFFSGTMSLCLAFYTVGE